MDSMIGKTLGQYQILEEIGRGGMAIVYKAHQPSLDRYIAIKVLPQQFTFDREFVERFLREARAAARLNHPNIVTIHDVGQANIMTAHLAGRCPKAEAAFEGRPDLPLNYSLNRRLVSSMRIR